MPKKKTTKAVTKKEEHLPSTDVMNFEQDSGAGFEHADADAYSIPYLIILQKNSPQVDEDDPKYVSGAKAGMFMNNVTEELFDEVILVPAMYRRLMVEWVPRDAGGGFRGSFDPADPRIADVQRGDDGKFVLENGNFLSDTRYHFVLQISGEGETAVFEPMVISLTSTQIKKSRNWMTKMNNFKMKGAKKMFTPPMYAHVVKATSVSESNDKGSWKGWKFDLERTLTGDEAHLYTAAQDFIKAIEAGSAQVTAPPETAEAEGEEDVAF